MYTDVIDLVGSFSYKIVLEGYTHLYVQYMVPSLQNVLLETPSFIRKKTHNKGSFLYFSCHSKCLQPDIDTVAGLDRSVAQNKMKVKLKNGCGPTYVCWVWHCPCPLLFNIFAEYSILICYMSRLQLSGCCFHLVSLCVYVCMCLCVILAKSNLGDTHYSIGGFSTLASLYIWDSLWTRHEAV